MASAEHVIKVRAELDNAVVVRPGDKLVIRVSRRIDQAEAAAMRAAVAEMLPGVEAVIIACDGLAVYRDEPTGIRKVATGCCENCDGCYCDCACHQGG